MLKIENEDGTILDITENPFYIRLNKNNGCYVPANANDAEGVAVNSTAYNLPGNKISDKGTVYLKNITINEIVQQLNLQKSDSPNE